MKKKEGALIGPWPKSRSTLNLIALTVVEGDNCQLL